jgi:hypothetical protein
MQNLAQKNVNGETIKGPMQTARAIDGTILKFLCG